MRIIEIITIKKYSFYSYLIGKGLVKEGRSRYLITTRRLTKTPERELCMFSAIGTSSVLQIKLITKKKKNIILWGNMTRCFIDKVCIFIDIANFSLKFKSWSQLLYSEWIWWNWCFLNFRLYSFTRHLQITNHHVC